MNAQLPPKPEGWPDGDWQPSIVRRAVADVFAMEAHLDIAVDTTPELVAAVEKLNSQRHSVSRSIVDNGAPVPPGENPEYSTATVSGAISDIANARSGTRNDLLFRKTARAAEHAPFTSEARDQIRAAARDASIINGHADEDGLRKVEGTIDRAFAAADRSGPAAVPARSIPQKHGVTVRPRGHTQQPPVLALEDAEAGFWESRESLCKIRDYALACMVSPWGLLGAILIYVLDFIPHYVALPGIADDDSPGSLNLFLALVGPSGANKGRTCRAARRYVGRSEVDVPPGSGEGLVKLFVRRPTSDEIKPPKDQDNPPVVIHQVGGDQFVYTRNNAVIDCAEVQSLAALGSRTGSTLQTILRQGFSGETLGFGYSDESKRLLVPADKYRLTMIVGVQPEHSDVLLNDAAGGTPQRFLWMPVTDRRVSRHNRPPKPKPTDLVGPTGLWPSVFGMCDAARDEIEQSAEARAQGVGDALDGHALFVRAKVAAAVAVLDGGRATITDEDWRLSGSVMAVSDLTRARCGDALTRAAARANEARGRGEGIRASVAEEMTHERATQRVVGVLVRATTAHGPLTTAALRKRLAARDRRFFEDALARAMECNQLITHEDGQVKVP